MLKRSLVEEVRIRKTLSSELCTLNSQKGFSLVELILVIVIVGFMIILIANIPNSISLIGQSHNASLAKDIASQKIEDLRAQTYDNLANGNSPIVDSRLTALPSGSGTATIIDCPNTVCTNGEQVKQVTAEVDWKDAGNQKNVKLVTFIAKDGLK